MSGIMVGFGSRLGNGCTSGHGLCGLPRFSFRSVAAVLTFLFSGILTATYSLASHIPELPWLKYSVFDHVSIPSFAYMVLCLFGTFLLIITEK